MIGVGHGGKGKSGIISITSKVDIKLLWESF
jgi:hypothetical protein